MLTTRILTLLMCASLFLMFWSAAYTSAGWRSDWRDSPTEAHFVFSESLLKMLLPVGSGLLVSLMFREGKEHPEECRETRVDIDRRLKNSGRRVKEDSNEP